MDVLDGSGVVDVDVAEVMDVILDVDSSEMSSRFLRGTPVLCKKEKTMYLTENTYSTPAMKQAKIYIPW